MAQTIVAAPRPGAVAAVLAQASRWTSARRKSDGRPFYIVPGSKAGTAYYADPGDCTCPDARERQRACKHSLAVALFRDREARRLGIATDAETDLIVARVALAQDPDAGRAVTPIATYGSCIVKACTEPAGGKSRRCGDHLDQLVATLGA